MTANNVTAENGLNQILNEIAKVDELVEAFNGYIQRDSLKNYEQIEKLFTMLTNIVTQLNDEQLSSSIKIILKVASTQTVSVRQKVFLNMLQKLVQKHGISSRLMCECIINSEYLVYTNSEFWIECFHIIKCILITVDYKGVREIMKGCIEKVVAMPKALPASILPQFLALEEVIRYIFDREACLLPGYFVINEILRVYSENKGWPHWKLGCLVSNFVESFRGAAQMTSMIGHSSMLPVVEHSGYGDHLITPWKLDPNTLKLTLKGNIPYPKQLLLPQTKLLRYVLEQPYSRDMVCSMLGLQKMNKQRCIVLEEQLVELIIRSMERSDKEVAEGADPEENHWLWLHISSQLIYFILFQFAVFPNIVNALHEKLLKKDLHRSRDRLMWVLLQYISGSIQRNSLENILPVLKLYDLLYPEKEPLPVPDTSNALCTHQMAITCIWIHLLRKALMDNIKFHRPIPLALKAHHDYLQMLVQPSNGTLCMGTEDYRVPLLCNAFSTNNECLSRPMAALVDAVLGSGSNRSVSGITSNTQQSTQSPVITPAVGGTSPVASVPGSGGTTSPISGNASSSNAMGPTTPLSMAVLDSLTIHAKMSLIHSIVTHVLKLAQSKSNLALAPALAETYSRLLVYTEIESLGIKGFISQVLPTVFKSHAWGILYTLLEMFSYRMHHIQPHYRVQLLSHLHSLAAVPQTNQTQLHLCVESTALRLITGLGSNEVQPQLSRFLSEPKTLVSAECEELNRALVLTLARSMHITGTSATQEGSWCKELLTTIMANTPHTWAPHTLQCFPPALADFFVHNPITKENKQQLKKAVEEEYRNWASMTNENDIIAHFSVPTAHPLFLCLLWKMIIETDRINPIAYKILERIGARALSAHLRKFCDYLVFKFAVSEEGQHVNKCVDAINSMIWKYNIVTIDRLVLCLALRTQEGSEAQVCFFIIQLLLFKGAEFRARVCEFVKENSPEHWKQSNWHEKHLAFHRKYPEKFAPEGILDPASYQPLPVYFGNVCLRFLPVFDIVIHRYLELPPVTKSLETLLDHLGCLYKFHDRPVTYLYNTLHYYESKLRDRPSLKRKLVYAVLGSLCETRGCWTLSDAYQTYNIQTPSSTNTNSMGTNTDVSVTPSAPIWVPNLEYYVMLVKRITDTMSGNVKFPNIDWRFNEFPNPAVYALYMTCAELMALPLAPASVANSILDVVMQRYTEIPSHEIHCWVNSIGLIMSALPEPFWVTLQDRIMQMMQSPGLATWQYAHTPFQLFNFDLAHGCLLDNRFVYMLALAHATWHHAGVGHIASIPLFVKEKLGPSVYSEEQFIFLCHLVAPFLSRYNLDKPSPSILDITVELFNALERMDKHVQTLRYMDPICDLLYHIKYQYVGNLMKSEVEGIVCRLRLPLQKKLRFITQLSLAEVEAMNQPSADPVVVSSNGTNGTAVPQNNNSATVPQ